MSDYTPDENNVALIYVAAWLEQSDPSPGRIYNEVEATAQEAFDRFIAKVKRDAAREALDGMSAEHTAAFMSEDRAHYRHEHNIAALAADHYKLAHYPEDVTP